MKKKKYILKRISAIALASTLIISSFPITQLTQAATSLSLTNKVTIGKGETFQLNTKETSSKVSFRSSNKKIVSVTKSGKIKGKKVGKATIIAKLNKKTKKCKVTVKAAPKKISFLEKEIILLPKQNQKLNVTFSSGYSNKIAYKSKNTSVATISANGTVTAKTPGITTITAKTFNGKTATIRCVVADNSTTPTPATISPIETPTVSATATPQAIVTTSASISKIENGTIYIDNSSITLGLTSCIGYYRKDSSGTLYHITKEELFPGDTIEITYSGLIAKTYPATLCDCDKIIVTNSVVNTMVEGEISNITDEHTLEITNHKDMKFYFDSNTKIYKKGQEITFDQLKNNDVIRVYASNLTTNNTDTTPSTDSSVRYAKTIVVLGDSIDGLQQEQATFLSSSHYNNITTELIWNTNKDTYLVTTNTLLEITQTDGSVRYTTINTTTNPLPILNTNMTIYYETIPDSTLKKAIRISYQSPYMHKNPIPIEKPIIYLYPKEKTDITVDLDFKGELTYTYPYTADGHWEVTANTDGTLTNKADNLEYSYLFWEGKSDNFAAEFSKGFCIKGEDTTKFLQNILPKMGLTQKEYNEFIVYWAPRMQENKYNLISFQTENYEQIAPLHINPAPDSMLRVYMAYKPLTNPVDIEPQTFESFERKGFSVVEWGGCMINN